MVRFMLVDDSSIMRRNLKLILENEGYTVVAEASDGEEALYSYQRYKPDIVTMDISMPNMDGITCLKRLLENDPQAKVIMISALGQKLDVIEAIKIGAKSYMIKPVERDRVLENVKSVIEKFQIAYKNADSE